MLKLEPAAQAYLSEIRALATDQNDKLVYVGLTEAESLWYANYLEASFQGDADRSDGSEGKYLALQDRHEEARRTVLAGESLMRSHSTRLQ